MSSSFKRKYQYRLASAKICTLFVVSKFYWYWLLSEVINKPFFQFVCPEGNGNVLLIEGIKINWSNTYLWTAWWICRKVLDFFKALGTEPGFCNIFSIFNFMEMHDWPVSSSSHYISCFLQLPTSFIFAIFAWFSVAVK